MSARGFLVALLPTLILLLWVDPVTIIHSRLKGDVYPPDAAYVGLHIVRDYSDSAPDILILGGSSTRELVPDRQIANAWFRTRCDHDIQLFNAATSSQEPADSRAIADALGEAPRVVVIGLSYRRLMRTREEDVYSPHSQTVALPSSMKVSIASLTRGDMRAGLFDFFAQVQRAEWSIAALRAEMGKSPRPLKKRDHHDRDVSPATPIPSSTKRYMADQMFVLAGDDMPRTSREMTEYWLRFAREMSRRGAAPLFVMTPYSPEAESLEREYAGSVGPALARLAEEYPVLDLRSRVRLQAADFADPTHLSDAGRIKAWPMLAEAIGETYGCPAFAAGA